MPSQASTCHMQEQLVSAKYVSVMQISSVRLLTFFLESTHLHSYSGLRYVYVYSCLRIFLAFPLPGID